MGRGARCMLIQLVLLLMTVIRWIPIRCNAAVLGSTLVGPSARRQSASNSKPSTGRSRRLVLARRRRQNLGSQDKLDRHDDLVSSFSWKTLSAQRHKDRALAALAAAASADPKRIAAFGASALILEYLRRNREAVTRALYFWTHAGPIVVHYKFTQLWLEAFTKADRRKRDRVYGALHDRYSQPALDLILHLKGLYVKLGQVMSARPDFIPRQYVDLFATLQDSLPQESADHVERTIRHALRTERGLEWEDVFQHMEPVALGSASIGQVHRAVLKAPWDNQDGYSGGAVVAVKVMSPGAESRFAHDFQVFRWLCRVALPGWSQLLKELERRMMSEFDYCNEAASLEEVRNNMARSRYAKHVRVPQPVPGLCCKDLLVMELLEGKKLSDAIEDKLVEALGGDREVALDFLKRKRDGFFFEQEIGVDSVSHDLFDLVRSRSKHSGRKWLFSGLLGTTAGAAKLLSLYRETRHYIDLLLDVHGHQIFLDGCFNGDPHPGNIILDPDSGKLGLIDYGQTRRLSDDDRISIAKVVSALGKSPVDTSTVAEAMRECGFKTKFDKDDVLARYAALFFDSDAEAKKLGCSTPQLYLMKLAEMDPLVKVPDSVVLVARTSFMFRGMGAMLDEQVHTSKRWHRHADDALLQKAQ